MGKENTRDFISGESEYTVGQKVQFDSGHEWVDGRVVNTTPERLKGLPGIVERLTGYKPIVIEIDKDAPTLAGAEIRISQHNMSILRPKAVYSQEE